VKASKREGRQARSDCGVVLILRKLLIQISKRIRRIRHSKIYGPDLVLISYGAVAGVVDHQVNETLGAECPAYKSFT
jgi:hypothetical protein